MLKKLAGAVKRYVSAHPASVTAIVASLLVTVLTAAGVDPTAVEAVLAIVVPTAVVSHKNPKTPS